jgi:hypothetical protein
MVTTIASLTARQGPAGSLVVNVSVTIPAVLSAALGVYVVFRAVALAKAPVPDVVQVDDVAPPPLVPVSETVAVFEQIGWSTFALTVATGLMVNISVTVPAVISAALGVYIAFKVVLLGLYAPVPPDHVALADEPPLVPASVAVLVEQIV